METGTGPGSRDARDASRHTQRRLIRTIETVVLELGGRPPHVTLESDLERDLGLGSLERVELLGRIEDSFSARLPDACLSEARRVADLSDALDAALASLGAPGDARRAAAIPPPAPPEGRDSGVTFPEQARTIVDVARYRAEAEGRRPHLYVIRDDGDEEVTSFAGLWEQSLRIAGGLAARGVERGDRVALILPTCTEFFTSYLGISAAAACPVPLYPPFRLDEIESYVERYTRLLRNADARLILTDRRIAPVARLLRDRVPGLREVLIAAKLGDGPGEGVARVAPDDLALIQYTSGSTGEPRGVALRHRNVVANVRAIGAGFGVNTSDSGVTWLPLYHDMGLIGLWMTAFMHGRPAVALSPLSFLGRPARWLWAIHRHRGTISPAPNFAYDLCVSRVRDEEIEGLDLSSWRCAMNGAEPVRPDTMERFIRRFEPYGFRRQAVMPVYGLAENAVALAFPPPGRPPRIDRVSRETFLRERRAEPARGPARCLEFVSCGRPLDGHEVRAVPPDDPAGPGLPERTEGRLLFRGPSTLKEYFRRPDATAEIRHGDWTDTGDLGYLADGELFVTGRVKDLIIKGGRNYHPQDIEQAAFGVEGIRRGNVVAFGAPEREAGEAIVVAAETREPRQRHAELAQRVVEAVRSAIGTPPDRVVLLPPNTVPKTSSGKLRRREAQARYRSGTLTAVRDGRVRQILALVGASLPRRGAAALRRGGRLLFGLYAAAVGLTLPVLGLVALRLTCRTEASLRAGARRMLRATAFLTGLTPRRLGERLPASGVVVVSNHASNIDALVLMAAIESPLVLLVKAPLFDVPVLGTVLRRLGFIPVRRTSGARSLEGYRAAQQAVAAGRLLHVFPEATFTPMNGVRPFRLGAFALASEHGLPVVPVAIRGTRTVLRDRQRLPRRARIEVEVLKPIVPPASADFRDAVRMRDAAREVLARRCGEPLLEIASAALPSGSQPDRDTSQR